MVQSARHSRGHSTGREVARRTAHRSATDSAPLARGSGHFSSSGSGTPMWSLRASEYLIGFSTVTPASRRLSGGRPALLLGGQRSALLSVSALWFTYF